MTEEKEEATFLDKKDVCKEVEACKINCIGRLNAQKDFPVWILLTLMKRAWRIEKLRVSKIYANVVRVFFPDIENMERVLKDGP